MNEKEPEKEQEKEQEKKLKRSVSHLDSDSEDIEKDDEIQYEDPFVDEFEEEEIPEEELNKEEDDDDQLPDEYIEKYSKLQISENEFVKEVHEEEEEDVFLENTKNNSETKLEFSNSAYTMLHRLDIDLPSLTLDIIKDDKGYNRTKFPLSCMCVLGTQAEKSDDHKIYVLKLQELHRTEFDSESDNEASEDDLDDEPTLSCNTIPMKYPINRIRSMPQKPTIISAMDENGVVSFIDISKICKYLNEMEPRNKTSIPNSINAKPFKTSKLRAEGFAMDWSPINPGVIALGDSSGAIKILELSKGTKWKQERFVSETGSIEDIRWSSEFASIFATCSNDKTIKIWDTRKEKYAFSFQASDVDVNAISWNHEVKNFLASGDDKGLLRVWDLRMLQKSTNIDPVAQFKYHDQQITSVEWNPNDSSVLTCCSADNKTTIWDLSVESDEKTETYGLPAQLMFVHQGQNGVKEVKWHPQLQNVLLTCSFDSLNIFKPSNFHEDKPEDEKEEEIFVKGEMGEEEE